MATIAPPYVVSPTGSWDGNDGSWSTFAIEVGTPPQSFRVLPSTVGEQVWIPYIGACEGPLSEVSNCGSLRGVNPVGGQASSGFKSNESSTWDVLNIYNLPGDLYSNTDSGYLGRDVVSLGLIYNGAPAYGPIIPDQVVAGIVSENYWLGTLGLGTSPGDYGGQSSSSLVTSMKANNLSTSTSFGYTAGQHYASPSPIAGNLVIGGYDATRITNPALALSFDSTASPQNLQVGIQSILATNTLQSSVEPLSTSLLVANIDTSTSQIWLPQAVCDSFAQAFGLTYDDRTELYLVNSSIHQILRTNNPSVTFEVGGVSGGASTNIVLNYNAFDLNASIPLYNTSRPYFPIRRAANTSQITLGRTFMQEAYIVVDWERNNLTIGQAVAQSSTSDTVPILPPSLSPSTNATLPVPTSTPAPQHTSHGISTGAIAGIVIAMLLVLGGGGLVAYFLRRRRRRQRSNLESSQADDEKPESGKMNGSSAPEKVDYKNPSVEVTEVAEMMDDRWPYSPMSSPIYELEEPSINRELMSTPVMEMHGTPVGSELDVSKIRDKEKSGMDSEIQSPQISELLTPRSDDQKEHISILSQNDEEKGSPLLTPRSVETVISPKLMAPSNIPEHLDAAIAESQNQDEEPFAEEPRNDRLEVTEAVASLGATPATSTEHLPLEVSHVMEAKRVRLHQAKASLEDLG